MPGEKVAGIDFDILIKGLENLTSEVVKRIDAMRDQSSQGSGMSIVKMFELQMSMSELENFSSMSTNVVSAIHTAAGTMARNIKG